MNGQKKKGISREELLLAVVVLFWFALYLHIPYQTPFLTAAGVAAGFTGTIVGAYGITQLAFRLPLGVLADYAGKHKIFVILGAGLAGLACLVRILVPTGPGFLAANLISGCAASTWIAYMVLYSNYFSKKEQQKATRKTAKAVAEFIQKDYQVIITHSNGPQVGMIHTAMSEFCRIYPEYTATPTAVCSAMSQGYIGYDLQNAIRTELLGRGIYKTVSTILTQVVVDPYDEAFYHPTKIIGRVMTEAEAEEEEKKGNHVTQVEGGYRRVVAAPKPVDIVEKDAIKALVDADQVVIACGGGGIPVLAQDNKLQGASAVIEKDLAAGKLADTLDADRLVILTSVDKVCLNYGKEDEKPLDTMTVDEAKKYLAAGEFDEGTMAPKIEAAIDFIGDSAIRSVLITKLNKEGKTVSGGMGTLITK